MSLRTTMHILASAITATCLLSAATAASEAELAGFVAVEGRVFLDGSQFPEQESGNIPTLLAEPELYYVSDDDNHTLTFRPFLRLDANDARRTHADLRQMDWIYADNGWEFRAGFSHVFWGVTESNHLVDIINQSDVIEDTDGEDKFGQPMLKLGKETEYGTFQLFWLPYFRERSFASQKGRLRGATLIDDDHAIYESGAKEWHQDIAVRYEHTWDMFDIGLAHFSGTSREPRLVSFNNGTSTVFRPAYDVIDQTSIDLQITTDSTLWKFEAITRAGHGDRFYAAVGGLEYSFYGVFDSDMDIGLLGEYHYDDRDMARAPFTPFDDDIFIGSRLVFNNSEDTQLLAGMMYDTETNDRSYSAEFSHRLTDHWKLETDLRILSDAKQQAGIVKDSHIQLRLARYF